MREDILTIEVLPDGTIKTSTDQVSAANHSSAEAFYKELARATDGNVSRTRKPGAAQTHVHHDHDHEHHH